MKFQTRIPVILILSFTNPALALVQPAHPPLPNFDKRLGAVPGRETVSPDQRRAVAQLQSRRPRAQVEFDPITGGPKAVWSGREFLTGNDGQGGAIPAATASRFAVSDPYRATKAFLLEYTNLFRHGPELLDQALLKQEDVMPHNGLRTAVWQQQVDGIPVFEAVLISHTTRRGELVNMSDQFLPDATGAVERGRQNRANLAASVKVSGPRAVAIATAQIDEPVSEEQVQAADASPNASPSIPDLAKRQLFRAPVLQGDAEAKLVWLPINSAQLRLSWDVILTGRTRGEMYRVLVDAQTGEPLLRRCLTEYISDATYRVYTNDSPSPFSPGYPTPVTNQPPLVPRSLVTISALDTNASPLGWMSDGDNQTLGNNVDAYSDTTGTDTPDLPRPQGSPFRVFDFPLDLSQDPSTYRTAAIVQLFYWCNWMHDQLYDLGFTEAAGNFQTDNFGRGGLGNDPVLAQAQDGGGFNNANFSTPPDGSSPRMRIYLWNSPTPARDGDLDAQVVLHELTHGLSNRRVGGGQGLIDPISIGLAEGWADFFALSLLSKSSDDVDGVYAVSAYSIYDYGGLLQNYYFGVRRYPYCTDLSKSPLTFKDIDPTQASPHTGIPRSPVIGTAADEVHNMGEVWCVALWDARANLIRQHGWSTANRLMLQLVTDGMALSPPNPNFLQARDGIIQADQVDTGGTNQVALWNAFAKRGMGLNAIGPSSGTSIGVQESYDVPDDLQIIPSSPAAFYSLCGQPVFPSCQVYLAGNAGSNVVNWTAQATAPWLSVSPVSGSTAPGTPIAVTVCLTSNVNALDNSAFIVFSNTVTTATDSRPVSYLLTLPVLCFPLDTQPAWAMQGEWAFGQPAGLGGTQYGNPDPTAGATGTNVFGINLNGDYAITVGGPYYLTAGPFDFSGYTGMTLQFQRWLNTDYQPYVYATIEASSDGINWSPVWDNGTTGITDSAWTQVSYDISAFADNQTNVFVRWGHQVASPLAFPYSGWNIDDIEFVGTPSQQLTVAIPPAANVGVGTLNGTVAASPAPTTNLTVALASSDGSAVGVPASILLSAGQSNAVFNLTVASGLQDQATETVLIRASAPNYVASSATIQVMDSNSLALHLALPFTAVEGEGTITGAVYIRDIQTNALLVQLSSSDITVLQVPDTVLIPVGQTTTVFSAVVEQDNLIDGPRTAVVTADTAGWTTANATVVVQDNKNLNLVVTLPASIWENAGVASNAGSVSISGILPTNLTVALTSSIPAKLSVPAFVTIPSGQVSDTFDLSPIDNGLADGNQMITILASAVGFTNGTAVITVLDDETPSVPSNPSPANLASNVVQTTGLAWQQALPPVETITNDVYFGTNPAPGPGQFVGSTTNQSWTLPVLAPQTTYYWQIIARQLVATAGPVWQFTTRGVDHFAWNAMPTPQYVNQPFPVVVTAQDAFGAVVSNFTGAVSLGSQSAPLSPTNSGPFALGVWQGEVTISQPASSVSLTATDGAGHAGASGLFDVVLTNDMSITMTANPDPVPAGMPLTYTLMVANSGAADATDVTVTDILPPNVNLLSLASPKVAGAQTNPVVTFDLGLVPGGSNATLTLVVVSTNVGVTLTNLAWVTRTEPEFYLDNNTARVETVVAPPAVSIADAQVIEGTSGTTNMQFAVTLSAPSPGTVSVSYSTADGTAVAGQDYLATNGVLVLAPGITNATVYVPVIGDVIVKTNEAFFVSLSAPTNAVLGRSQAVGTILEIPPGNVPPTVLVQPSNQVAVVGVSVTFDVVAEGSLPLSYQWSFNGTNVGGATNSTLVMADVQPTNSGTYAVVVSNAFGAAPSSNAVLSVGEAPAIVAEPASQTVSLGGKASFQVSAAGTQPLSYQWSKGGTNLLAATNYELVITNVQLTDAGSYAVSVSNVFGSANSSNAVLAIGLPPTITIQPTNLALPIGATASFTALAVGTAPLTYQWAFNGTNLLAASDTQLVLTNVQLTDAGSYALSVSNLFGSAKSSNAVLRVGQPPGIVAQPTNQTVGLGAAASFAVVANGTTPLAYQWNFRGTNLLNATNSVLALANVQSNNVGNYAVRVFSPFGSTNSTNALLAIGPPPVILIQPTSLVVTVGTAAAFHVLAGDAPGPFTYQWSFNGTNLLNATNDVLAITNARLTDAGTYAAVASNAYGSAASSNAVLFVGAPPMILAQPTNQLTQFGSSVAFTVLASGTAPLGYQWNFAGTNVSGATSNVLVITNVQLSNLGSYAVQVTNAFGSSNSSAALLAIGGPPSIVVPPTNQDVPVGAMAILSVVAVGTPPLSYQWTLVGGPSLPYATNSVLVVTNVQDGSRYNVLVTNALGSVRSANARLSVGVPPTIVVQPTNEFVVPGSVATFSVVASGSAPLGYQWQFNGHNLPAATNSVLMITNAQASNSGRYRVRISNAFGFVGSDIVTLSVGQPPIIVVPPTNQTVRLGNTASFGVVATGTAPLEYQWSFGGTNLAGATTNVLVITNAQSSNAGSYAVAVSNPYGSTNSPNAVLTVGVPPSIVLQPTNQVARVGDSVTFATLANGTPPLACQWSFNGTNRAGATNNVLVLTNAQLSDAGTYAAQMSNAFGSQTSSNAVLSVGVPPVIVVPPTNQTVRLGNTASFGVVATGTAPLQYQWSFGGTNLAGATTNVLVITNAQSSNAGSYAVAVSNPYGSTNSPNAVLTVGIPPAIAMQPTNLSVAVGGVATFSVAANGTPPLSYQWTFNSTNVLPVTNSVLAITNVQLTNGGSYSVVVLNAFGAQQSSNALLSVGVPPSILVQPTNLVLSAGAIANFGISASGTTPLSYQWLQGGFVLTNGGRITGANSNELTISNVVPTDSSSYWVAVSNSWGSALSSNATLSVYPVDHFAWDPIPSPRFIGVPFPVRIAALDATNGLVSGFAGTVGLGSTSGLPVKPSLSGAFVLGTWTGSVAIAQSATGAVLVANDGFGHVGYANPINVVVLPSLSAIQSGTTVVISWPAEASFTPETSTDMSSWSPLTSQIVLIGDTYQTRVPISAGRFFYRLRFIGP